ncbi:hypothetical protein C8D92_101108 [Tamilnaduibacter salinus]|uniref:ATPase n=1 Tax=Tamilnaduibacter salinus TaxID=1484056 RepID=A0A2U1D0K1_9GAMM|nr:ATPase [Tamilnaduibacter salinus]PVY78904.1 hypothetical protein C8D92_101108 [Tamilnaduibacter salinus]
MEIRTFGELIEWSRSLHHYLSESLRASSEKNQNERARALLDYLARHESQLDQMVAEFEKQSDPGALGTRVYDFLSHHPLHSHRTCDTHYSELDFEEISREVFDFHDQVIAMYRVLIGRADIPEVRELLESLLAMEEHEAMRLASQIGRMRDL